MQAQWNNGGPYYRCRYPAEYALINEVDHPTTVSVRQGHITRPLDKWLSTIFDPANLDETCTLLAAANDTAQPDASRAHKAATAKLALCDRRLEQYRKALDSGADRAVVAKWISDVQLERSTAERVLVTQRATQPITPAEIRDLIDAVEDKVRMLANADPITKAALYTSLGLTLTYEHDRRVVRVEALPTALGTNERVGGGLAA